jgi:hypothetical protein
MLVKFIVSSCPLEELRFTGRSLIFEAVYSSWRIESPFISVGLRFGYPNSRHILYLDVMVDYLAHSLFELINLVLSG